MPVSIPGYFGPARASGTVVGASSGANTTGSRNFLAMRRAGQSSTANDLIVIGDLAGSAGIGTSAQNIGSSGTILVGTNAGAAVTGSILNAGTFPSILIGRNVLQTAQGIDSCVVIGDNSLAAMPGTNNVGGPQRITCVGVQNFTAMAPGVAGSFSGDVFIGDQMGNSGPAAGTAQISQSVFIGSGACNHADAWANPCLNNVIVGAQAMNQTLTTPQNNTVVGSAGFQSPVTSPTDNIMIGVSTAPNAVVSPTRNITIGDSSAVGQDRSIFIGHNITGPTLGGLSRVVAIGCGAGFGAVGVNDSFFLETYDQITQRTLLYGRFDTGNLIVGNSAANRGDAGNGTNTLKIVNGTIGAAPTGGGLFYVVAGDLHWFNSAGADTRLSGNVNLPAPAAGVALSIAGVAGSPIILLTGAAGSGATLQLKDGNAGQLWNVSSGGSGAGLFSIRDSTRAADVITANTTGNVTLGAPTAGDTLTLAPSAGTGALIATSAALTNNAGAAAGTLTNAPAAGNPTKWIKINDNGTIRSVPAW
jgi:hypothetical protein